jgi:hypothetical protein
MVFANSANKFLIGNIANNQFSINNRFAVAAFESVKNNYFAIRTA